MYILIKEYGLEESRTFQYSTKPFLIEDVDLDYKNGHTYIEMGRTINLPKLRYKVLFDKKRYAIGNPLSEEEQEKGLQSFEQEVLTAVDNGEKYVFKRPKHKLCGIQTYDGQMWHFVEPDEIIIPLVDIVNGRYIEGFSQRVYEQKPFVEVLGPEDGNPKRKIVSEIYKIKQAELVKEEQKLQATQPQEDNMKEDMELKQTSTPRRRK